MYQECFLDDEVLPLSAESPSFGSQEPGDLHGATCLFDQIPREGACSPCSVEFFPSLRVK